MSLSQGQMSLIDRLFGPQEAKPPKTSYISEVLKDTSNRTNINQIRGISRAGSSGSGIPKHVTNITAAISNASVGSTSKVILTFRRDSTDTAFGGVTIFARGYQGNQSPTQVGYGTDAPLTIILNNTGESVSLIVQATGNGGSAPMDTAPSCGVKLPAGANGGFGLNTTTNLTLGQIPTSGGSGFLSISQTAAPASVNLTTEGSLDWCCTSPANSANYPAFNWVRWKQTGGEIARTLRMVAHNGSQSKNSSPSGGGTAFTATDQQADVTEAAAALTSYSGFVSQNSNAAGRDGFGFQFDITATGQAERTLNIYCGGDMLSGSSGAQITVFAQLTDGSASSVSTTFNIVGGNVQTWKKITVVLKSANSSRLFVQILISNANNQLCETLFQAVTLS